MELRQRERAQFSVVTHCCAAAHFLYLLSVVPMDILILLPNTFGSSSSSFSLYFHSQTIFISLPFSIFSHNNIFLSILILFYLNTLLNIYVPFYLFLLMFFLPFLFFSFYFSTVTYYFFASTYSTTPPLTSVHLHSLPSFPPFFLASLPLC